MLPSTTWRPELVARLAMGLLASISLGVILVQGLESLFAQGTVTRMVTFCVGTLSFHGVALFFIHLFLKEHGISWRQAFGFDAPRMPRALLLAAVVALLVLPLALSLSHLSVTVLKFLKMKVEVQPAVQALQSSVGVAQRIYFGVVAILIAPVVEELVFRGILYPFLKQAGYRRMAVWATSLIFALSHANVMTFVALTFIGVVLTLLYETTGTLFAPMLTHSLFNATNFLFLISDRGS